MDAQLERDRRQLLIATVLIGIGLMAAIDEIVFHQILAWHHFYDGDTADVALLSDGLLHAAELVAIVAGFFMFADLRDRGVSDPTLALSGGFLGAGGFQIFDGFVDHKILRLHQIRYDVDILPYDVAWNAAGIVMIIIGVFLARKGRSERHLAEPRDMSR